MNSDVSIWKRFGAVVIDILLVVFLYSLVVNIRFINPNYDKYLEHYKSYSETTEKFNKEEITSEEYLKLVQDDYYLLNKYSISYGIAAIVVVMGYFCIFQWLNYGQTIGKKIFKIKVVGINSENVKIWQYLIRYCAIFIPTMDAVLNRIINIILLFTLSKVAYIYATGTIYYIFIIFTAISMGMMIVKQDGRGLHDKIARTKVINE